MDIAVVFDLDLCLTGPDELGAQFYAPAFDAITEANAGAISQELLAQAFSECWRFPFDDVAERFGFTPTMRAAGLRAFANLAVTKPLPGYPDLAILAELPVVRFLVTSGFRRLQESKIAALGIARLFEAVYIDAIDEPNRRGKAAIFADLLTQHGLRASQTVVVGDNPDSELAAGNRLGMPTVQILRPGVLKGNNASHTITGLAQLKALLSTLSDQAKS